MEKLFDVKFSIFREKFSSVLFTQEVGETYGIFLFNENTKELQGEMYGFSKDEIKNPNFKNDFMSDYLGDFLADICCGKNISYFDFEKNVLAENNIDDFYYEGEKW